MWVEPELLNSGGDVARSAGKRVLGGAATLAAAPIGAGIFGDFDAARSFHQRLSQHHIGQVTKMRNNHRTLTDVGQKAKTGAGLFTETERQNIEEVSQIPDA
jgi:Protein of unknown function (DUF2563)